MATATVTSKGQITIPAQVRSKLGLGVGDRVEFVEIENGQFAIMAATQSIQALKGLVGRSEENESDHGVVELLPPHQDDC